MSGARIEVDVDSDEVRRAMGNLVLNSARLQPVFEDIGAALLTSTQQRFEDEEDPEGEEWEELAERTQKRRVSKRRVRGPDHKLRVTGQLLGSLTYLADNSELALGSNKVYAALHQMGGTGDMPPGPAAVPARPYLGISQDDEDEIAAVLAEHVQRWPGGAA